MGKRLSGIVLVAVLAVLAGGPRLLGVMHSRVAHAGLAPGGSPDAAAACCGHGCSSAGPADRESDAPRDGDPRERGGDRCSTCLMLAGLAAGAPVPNDTPAVGLACVGVAWEGPCGVVLAERGGGATARGPPV